MRKGQKHSEVSKQRMSAAHKGKCSTPALPASIREMSLTEAAWVGAMIEGEGSVGCTGRRRQPVEVRVFNTEVETIATCLRLTGGGSVYLHKERRARRKNCWTWAVQRIEDLRVLLPQIIPFLTGKQERAREALRVLS